MRSYDRGHLAGVVRAQTQIGFICKLSPVDIRPGNRRAVRLEIKDLPPENAQQHGLVNDSPKRDEVLVLALLEADSRPINRVRFRQPPLERAIKPVYLLHDRRVHFVFVAKQQRTVLRVRS